MDMNSIETKNIDMDLYSISYQLIRYAYLFNNIFMRKLISVSVKRRLYKNKYIIRLTIILYLVFQQSS